MTAHDTLAELAAPDVQRQAAQMAQDAFSRVFRCSIESTPAELDTAVGELARRIANWSTAAGNDDGAALRLAMLISGLDQWGIAYTRAFSLTAIPGLSALIGLLRTDLDERQDARFQLQFATIDANEGNAIDFKMELRRTIHLALWHALICADDAAADTHTELVTTLGSLLLSLDRALPTLGWRLIADTLAHIQIRCLGTALSEPAQAHTAGLFESLRQALPAERAAAIFTLANQAAVSWQQSNRQVH
jgi:hypothetical protein